MKAKKSEQQILQGKLIKKIVSRLKKFGFVHVNEDNIMTDEVYRTYFVKILNAMLSENTGNEILIRQLLMQSILHQRNSDLIS